MATYLEICQSVRAQAGISGDGPTSVVSQTGIYADIIRWVDESYNEIQTLHENWNFSYKPVTFTLQQNLNSFPALSADGIRQIAKDSFIIQPLLGNKKRLKYVSWYAYKNRDEFLQTKTGMPEYVTEDPSGTLIFYPTADDDYTIYYEGYARPDVMTLDADTPIFAHQFHDLIKLLALMKYAQYYNAMEIYQTAERNYNLLLNKMEYSELPKDNIVLVPLV